MPADVSVWETILSFGFPENMNGLINGAADHVGSHSRRAVPAAGHRAVVYDSLSAGQAWAVRSCPLMLAEIENIDRLTSVRSESEIHGQIHPAAGAISRLCGTGVDTPVVRNSMKKFCRFRWAVEAEAALDRSCLNS